MSCNSLLCLHENEPNVSNACCEMRVVNVCCQCCQCVTCQMSGKATFAVDLHLHLHLPSELVCFAKYCIVITYCKYMDYRIVMVRRISQTNYLPSYTLQYMAGGKHTTGTCGRGLRNDANGVVAPLTLGDCVVNVTQPSRLWIV